MNGSVNLVLDREGFSAILRIRLQCFENLASLVRGESFSRDYRYLFFFVELLVELLVLMCDSFDVDEALVLC